MNAITMLTEQHRKVEKLFSEYETAESETEKRACFEMIADDLAVHTTIEEKIFYPAAYAGNTEQSLEEALREHLTVKRLIVDLSGTIADLEAFDAKMKTLKAQVQHHVKEEEGKLFPSVTKRLDEARLEELAEKMEKLFTREVKAGPTRKLEEQADVVMDTTTSVRH